MNAPPGFNAHQQPQPPAIYQLRGKLLPGVITAGIAGILAFMGTALPFVDFTFVTVSTFGMAFDGSFGFLATLVGIMLIPTIVIMGAAPLVAFLKPTPGWTVRAGIAAIVAGGLGLLFMIVLMFVVTDETGTSVSSSISYSNSQMPGVASWGVGTWFTIIAFIAGIVGGVLFFMNSRPFDSALRDFEQQAGYIAFGPHAQYQQPGPYSAKQSMYPAQPVPHPAQPGQHAPTQDQSTAQPPQPPLDHVQQDQQSQDDSQGEETNQTGQSSQ